MSTAYTILNSDIAIGVQTFEKFGEDKPRSVFHWAIEPIQFYIDYVVAPRKTVYIAIESGGVLTAYEFIVMVLDVSAQVYDKLNVPD